MQRYLIYEMQQFSKLTSNSELTFFVRKKVIQKYNYNNHNLVRRKVEQVTSRMSNLDSRTIRTAVNKIKISAANQQQNIYQS